MGQALYPEVKEWFDGLTDDQQAQLKSAPSPKKIAQRILRMEDEGRFNMNGWVYLYPNPCKTTMCMAGWAMDSAGLKVNLNEDVDESFLFDDGSKVDEEFAGAFLLSLDEEEAKIFYTNDRTALQFIKDRWNL